MIKRSSNDGGFTLVEVLVALSLLALISGLFLMMVSQFQRLRNIQLHLDAQAELSAALDHIGQVVGSARQLPLLGQSNSETHFMIGNPNSLEFVSVVRTGANKKGLRKIQLFLEPSDNGRMQLMEKHALRRPFAKNLDELSSEYLILENVTELKMTYASEKLDGPSENAPSKKTHYENVWKVSSALPDAIRVEVSIEMPGSQVISAERYFGVK